MRCVGFACWIGPLSAVAENASSGLARAAAVRAALFHLVWLMISGWAPADLPVGVAAVAGATWTSLRLLPPKGSRFRSVIDQATIEAQLQHKQLD